MPYHPLPPTANKQVIIITEAGDLIFGSLVGGSSSNHYACLERARVRLGSRPASTPEVCSLAIWGPEKGEQLSEQLPLIEIGDVRVTIVVTDAAASAWCKHKNE
jgi:hypothetical protein